MCIHHVSTLQALLPFYLSLSSRMSQHLTNNLKVSPDTAIAIAFGVTSALISFVTMLLAYWTYRAMVIGNSALFSSSLVILNSNCFLYYKSNTSVRRCRTSHGTRISSYPSARTYLPSTGLPTRATTNREIEAACIILVWVGVGLFGEMASGSSKSGVESRWLWAVGILWNYYQLLAVSKICLNVVVGMRSLYYLALFFVHSQWSEHA